MQSMEEKMYLHIILSIPMELTKEIQQHEYALENLTRDNMKHYINIQIIKQHLQKQNIKIDELNEQIDKHETVISKYLNINHKYELFANLMLMILSSKLAKFMLPNKSYKSAKVMTVFLFFKLREMLINKGILSEVDLYNNLFTQFIRKNITNLFTKKKPGTTIATTTTTTNALINLY